MKPRNDKQRQILAMSGQLRPLTTARTTVRGSILTVFYTSRNFAAKDIMAVKASEYRKKVERYRDVYSRFVKLCADGNQTVSFKAFCEEEGVEYNHMSRVLKDEYVPIDKIPGYCRVRQGRLYQNIYETFKEMCAEGRQPGTFSSYCIANGTTIERVHSYLKRLKLRVCELPGFSGPKGNIHPRIAPIPFENVIFEEAGFLPAGNSNVITVSVDGHVAVSFPADTDVAVIANFVKKMGKG